MPATTHAPCLPRGHGVNSIFIRGIKTPIRGIKSLPKGMVSLAGGRKTLLREIKSTDLWIKKSTRGNKNLPWPDTAPPSRPSASGFCTTIRRFLVFCARFRSWPCRMLVSPPGRTASKFIDRHRQTLIDEFRCGSPWRAHQHPTGLP